MTVIIWQIDGRLVKVEDVQRIAAQPWEYAAVELVKFNDEKYIQDRREIIRMEVQV